LKTNKVVIKKTLDFSPYLVREHVYFNFISAAHGDLIVPRTRLQLGNWAFCVAGPVAWNSLLLDIRSAPTLSSVNVQKHARDTSFLMFLLN